jgi:hypothetical protein
MQEFILSENYVLSLPSATEPRVCEFGFVGDVNAITETKGNGN